MLELSIKKTSLRDCDTRHTEKYGRIILAQNKLSPLDKSSFLAFFFKALLGTEAVLHYF